MEIDARRKLAYKLLRETTDHFVRAHQEAVRRVVKVFPLARPELERRHADYRKWLEGRLYSVHEGNRDDYEPLWQLMTMFDMSQLGADTPYFDVGTFDELLRQSGIEPPSRD